MFRKLRGWFRLFVFDVCPHCNSDARHQCPVCNDLATYVWSPEEKELCWQRFRKLLAARRD